MTRLIDADAFMEHVKQTVKAGLISEKYERKLLSQINVEAEINAVDAVPVIRCKECKYRPNTSVGWIGCPMTGKGTRQDDDYCSYASAERKKND